MKTGFDCRARSSMMSPNNRQPEALQVVQVGGSGGQQTGGIVGALVPGGMPAYGPGGYGFAGGIPGGMPFITGARTPGVPGRPGAPGAAGVGLGSSLPGLAWMASGGTTAPTDGGSGPLG